MGEWVVKRTDTFSKVIKKFSKHTDLLNALDKKIKHLKENPEKVGGNLSGKLHGLKSTRLVRRFRLVFKVVKEENTVYLVAIDHREHAY